MKHLLVLSGLSLLFTGAALAGAEGPCASFGKYGAMRTYKGTGQMTSNTEFDLNHMRTKNEKSLYHVAVSEQGKEMISYFVTVEAEGSSCKILDVTETSVAGF